MSGSVISADVIVPGETGRTMITNCHVADTSSLLNYSKMNEIAGFTLNSYPVTCAASASAFTGTITSWGPIYLMTLEGRILNVNADGSSLCALTITTSAPITSANVACMVTTYSNWSAEISIWRMIGKSALLYRSASNHYYSTNITVDTPNVDPNVANMEIMWMQ